MNYLTYQANLFRIQELHRHGAAQRLAYAASGRSINRPRGRLARALSTLMGKLRLPAPSQPARGPAGATTPVPRAPHH